MFYKCVTNHVTTVTGAANTFSNRSVNPRGVVRALEDIFSDGVVNTGRLCVFLLFARTTSVIMVDRGIADHHQLAIVAKDISDYLESHHMDRFLDNCLYVLFLNS